MNEEVKAVDPVALEEVTLPWEDLVEQQDQPKENVKEEDKETVIL